MAAVAHSDVYQGTCLHASGTDDHDFSETRVAIKKLRLQRPPHSALILRLCLVRLAHLAATLTMH